MRWLTGQLARTEPLADKGPRLAARASPGDQFTPGVFDGRPGDALLLGIHPAGGQTAARAVRPFNRRFQLAGNTLIEGGFLLPLWSAFFITIWLSFAVHYSAIFGCRLREENTMSQLRQPFSELSPEVYKGLVQASIALEKSELGSALVELVYLRLADQRLRLLP
jgi:hypothetical protein